MTERNRSHGAAALAGAILVVSFFLPWIDLGGITSVSGLGILLGQHTELLTRIVVLFVPITGLMLMSAAAVGERRARSVALVTGLGILGYTAFQVARTFLSITGYGLWLVLAAAVGALVVGLALPRK